MTIRVEIVGDTRNHAGVRITSVQYYAPRFLLAEINTHRILAKSAESSRAVPVKKRIERVMNEPYCPVFTKNQKGMQADASLDAEAQERARDEWHTGMMQSAAVAGSLASLEAHKQHANRVLEPYAHVYGVLTATEWDNFFELRRSAAAQPEFHELADAIHAALKTSVPMLHIVHLPYITEDERVMYPVDTLMNISAARCARVSYKTQDGGMSTPDKDLELCKRLLDERHMSPFDHPATADRLVNNYWNNPRLHRQFYGWVPHRVVVERMLGLRGRRDSFAQVDPEDLK